MARRRSTMVGAALCERGGALPEILLVMTRLSSPMARDGRDLEIGQDGDIAGRVREGTADTIARLAAGRGAIFSERMSSGQGVGAWGPALALKAHEGFVGAGAAFRAGDHQ